MLLEGEGVAGRVLKELGVDLDITRHNILKELDPNCSLPLDVPVIPRKRQSETSDRDSVDLRKRYDVHCREGDRDIVYQNVRFKGIKTLLPGDNGDSSADYVEIEQADGQIVFVARSALIRFCEHRTTRGEAS